MTKVDALVRECRRLEESCMYTSATFFNWLRYKRRVRAFFVVAPLVLGSAATWTLLTKTDLSSIRAFVSTCSFLAGLLPSIYASLKFDDHLSEAATLAAEYKNLQDRFRQVATVSSGKPYAEFEVDFRALMERLEAARKGSLTPPERFFKAARRKIKAGDYSFDSDAKGGSPQGKE